MSLTVGELGDILQSNNFNPTYSARIERLIRFYKCNAQSDDFMAFLKMVIDEPNKFKKFDEISKRWKVRKSFHDVFYSIRQVCMLPEIRELLGDRYDEVLNAHSQFLDEMNQRFASRNMPNAPSQNGAERVTPDDDEPCGEAFDDDNYDDNYDDSDDNDADFNKYHHVSTVGGVKKDVSNTRFEKINDEKKKFMILHIKHLRDTAEMFELLLNN